MTLAYWRKSSPLLSSSKHLIYTATHRFPDRPTSPSIRRARARSTWQRCSTSIVGWSIGDRLRSELVVDGLEMACWRRRSAPGQTVLHSDRGAQYTSWAFGHRLRDAGLLGSMGRVGSAYDNAMMESFFSTLQRELLDRRKWATRKELASAIFEWIGAWYNPHRRHSSIGHVSPIACERLYTKAAVAA